MKLITKYKCDGCESEHEFSSEISNCDDCGIEICVNCSSEDFAYCDDCKTEIECENLNCKECEYKYNCDR